MWSHGVLNMTTFLNANDAKLPVKCNVSFIYIAIFQNITILI